MNRKGDDAVNFIPFFFLIVVIAGTIAFGVYAFFGTGYDARQSEAESLFLKVADCVREQGDKIFGENFSISECGLDEKVLEKEHLVLVGKDGKRFLSGVFDYSNQCFFEAAKKDNELPKCAAGNVDGYEITAGSNQRGKRI